MKEELISYETAVKAKEKGFDVRCNYAYNQLGTLIGDYIIGLGSEGLLYKNCYAPTQSLLAKWLREEHNIHCTINPYGDGLNWSISAITFTNKTTSDGRLIYNKRNNELMEKKFQTYEQALEAALKEALDLIPDKKQ